MKLVNHPNFWLRDDAAASLARLEADKGVISINSAGRTTSEQQALINRWDKGGKFNRPPYLYSPQRPASKSNHVANGGRAVDTSHITLMLNVGRDYGWVQSYAGDPVHFEYEPSLDKHRNRPSRPASGTAKTEITPVKNVRKRRMFTFIKDAKSDTIYVVSLVTGNRVGIKSIADLSLLRRFRDNDNNDAMLVIEMDIVKSYLAQLV